MGKSLAIALITVGLTFSQVASAEQRRDCTVLTRANVAQCAAGFSLSTKAELQTLDSLSGRRRAAGVFLPSNPVLTVTGGGDIEPTILPNQGEALWSATLSQELEIAGQRGRRLDLVAAEQRAQTARITVARRGAGADALLLYFDAVAAREESKLAERLARLAAALTAVAKARAQAGVSADLEAQLAEAAAARLLQAELAAQNRVATTTTSLANAVGLDPQTRPGVEGDLTPIDVTGATDASLSNNAAEQRPEIQLSRANGEALDRRTALFERLRVPNPTVSVFARNDWINERLFGVAVSIPIPLPSPVGRTYAGEIAESSALAARAETDTERLRRTIRLEIANALQSFSTRKRQVALFDPAQVQQTEETLKNIADEIEARRLPVRDALLTQQSLIDYLFAYVEARRQLCFASVELARASGVALEGGAP